MISSKYLAMATMVAALAAGAVVPAEAGVATITVSGTVSNFANGNLKLFGVEAASLLGSPMTEVLTFDLSKGLITNSGGNYAIDGEGATSPGSLIATIGGHVLSIDGSRGSHLGYAVVPPLFPGENTVDMANGDAETDNGVLFDYGGIEISDSANTILANGELTQAGSYTLTAADNAYMYLVGEADCGKVTCATDQFSGAIDKITFAVSAPEPATWGMMTVGLGLIGGAARASRRRSATAGAG